MVEEADLDAVENLKAQVQATRVQAMRAHRDNRNSTASQSRLPARDDAGAPQLVCLDVGGVVYTASRGAFTAVPDSWLAKVATGMVKLPKTAQDVRFIDRDAQAFRFVLHYLRGLTTQAAASARPSPLLPTGLDDLNILRAETRFYQLPELESAVASAIKSLQSSEPTSAQNTGAITAAAANSVVDDTTDIWNRAARMQLEFQSVYVTISSPNGLEFTERERQSAMNEVNEQTAALQVSGFRVKAMNTGVAQDRKSKDYCMYFHAVLVRNTGKRVPGPANTGESPDKLNGLPPRSMSAEGNAPTSSQPQGSKGRASSQARGGAPSSQANGAHRSEGVSDKVAGISSSVANPLSDYDASDADATVHASSRSSLRVQHDDRGNPPQQPEHSAGARLSDGQHREAGAAAGGAVRVSPERTADSSQFPRDDSFQHMHHTSANSTQGHSRMSAQANTASTIDSMLAAGGQAGGRARDSGDVDRAHAAVIANLELPNIGGRYSDVRVFDINTDGPPKGIPEDWEEGLLEGRKRPVALRSPAEEHAAGSSDHIAMVANARLAATAQHAAEASVEQAKKRASAARAKMHP